MRAVKNFIHHLSFFVKTLVGLVVTWIVVVVLILPAWVAFRTYFNSGDADVSEKPAL